LLVLCSRLGMQRCLGLSNGWVLESRGQQTGNPFIHLLGEDWIGMHWQPDIFPIAPYMVGQSSSHSWSAWRAPLAQALMWHHQVVEADYEPAFPAVARVVPGQTPSMAPQGRDQPTQGAIPTFHEGRLDRRAKLAQAQLLAKTAWATADHAPADLYDLASRVADLDDLGVKQGWWSHQPWLRLAADFPTTPRTRYTTPTTWRSAAVEAFQPSVSKRGSPCVRATTCAMSAAAISWVRGPKSTHRRNQLPIAKAVCTHSTCLGRRLEWASSNWTPGTSTSRTT
jgi:hypothetical protein